jgi:hypothetical protein
VANYLEFSAEDGEAERKKAIGEVVELGQEVWVKVRQRWRMFGLVTGKVSSA